MVKESEIAAVVKTQFIDAGLEWVEVEKGDPHLFVPESLLHSIIKYIKESETLSFDYLMNVSAFDAGDHLEVVYHLYSYKQRHRFVIKVRVPRAGGEIPTVSDLYGTADFQEREVYDHFGVRFKGHPHLTRILLPQDWEGYPLLKDYKEQAAYNGIETTRPPLLEPRSEKS